MEIIGTSIPITLVYRSSKYRRTQARRFFDQGSKDWPRCGYFDERGTLCWFDAAYSWLTCRGIRLWQISSFSSIHGPGLLWSSFSMKTSVSTFWLLFKNWCLRSIWVLTSRSARTRKHKCECSHRLTITIRGLEWTKVVNFLYRNCKVIYHQMNVLIVC